jgi:hypothetical protein
MLGLGPFHYNDNDNSANDALDDDDDSLAAADQSFGSIDNIDDDDAVLIHVAVVL